MGMMRGKWLGRFGASRRGMAAVEFALIAPTLIMLVLGVFEMALRFRAKEETTRYVHQISDLISREEEFTEVEFRDLFLASVNMMKPINDSKKIAMDVSSITFDDEGEASYLWRRFVRNKLDADLNGLEGLAPEGESIIRVAVRYDYTSPLTSLIGGQTMAVIEESITRPREVRRIPIDGVTSDNSATSNVPVTIPGVNDDSEEAQALWGD